MGYSTNAAIPTLFNKETWRLSCTLPWRTWEKNAWQAQRAAAVLSRAHGVSPAVHRQCSTSYEGRVTWCQESDRTRHFFRISWSTQGVSFLWSLQKLQKENKDRASQDREKTHRGSQSNEMKIENDQLDIPLVTCIFMCKPRKYKWLVGTPKYTTRKYCVTSICTILLTVDH